MRQVILSHRAEMHVPDRAAEYMPPSSINWTAICLLGGLCSALLSGIAYLQDSGRWLFAGMLCLRISIQGLLWLAVVRHERRSFALKAAFVAMMISPLFPIVMCLVTPWGQDYMFPFSDVIFSAPITAAWSGFVPALAILVVIMAMRLFRTSPKTYNSLSGLIQSTSPRFEIFLILCAGLTLFGWVGGLLPTSPVFYILRVMKKVVFMAPLIAGFAAHRFRMSTKFWIASFALGLVAATLTGGRGAVFTPLIYFLAGYFFSMASLSQAIRRLFIFMPLLVLLAMLAVWIGNVRDVVGRVDIFQAISGESMITANQDDLVQLESEAKRGPGFAYQVCRRMISWPSYVVPAATPNLVPYRGFDDFHYEIKGALDLGIFALAGRNTGFYFSNIFLKPYGFAVHVDSSGMKTSNVEFGVFVSGVTRGGWMVGFSFLCIIYCLIYLLEVVLKAKLLPKYQPLCLVMIICTTGFAMQTVGNDTLIESIREMVLFTTFTFLAYGFIDRGMHALGIRR